MVHVALPLLEIGPHRAVPGHSDECEIAGMGKVELEATAAGLVFGERRLAVRPGREGECFRVPPQVGAEDLSQRAVRNDETPAMTLRVEAPSARLLLGREDGPECVRLAGWIEPDAPDMHRALLKGRVRRSQPRLGM